MAAYTVKIENALGEMLQLYPSEDYILADMTGITPADAVINSVEMANLDGARYNNSRVGIRNLVITIKIRGKDADVRRSRINLYKYAKTKQKIRVYIAHDQRDVVIDGYLESLQDGSTIFTADQRLMMSIICPDPYFRDNGTGDRLVSFSAITPMFNFPFHIVSPIPFSTRDEVHTKIIENDGDVSCGVVLNVLATDSVTNPWFYNETTGERMTFEITLEDGDELVVSTVQGRKSAKLYRNGEEINVINTLAHGSTWLTLEPGANAFYYNAESGVAGMSLSFLYTILYEGI